MWNTVKLTEIVNIDIGKTPARSNPKYWDKNKKSSNIWVSIRDMSANSGLYIDDSREYISNEGAKLFKEVPKNTLIMSFKLSIGKLAITKINLRTNEAIAAFGIKDETIICKEYLYYYLSSMNWDKIVGHDIKVKGKTLNKAKLKEILILLPPLTEQQRIVAKLDAVFAEIDKTNFINMRINKNLNEISDKFTNLKFDSIVEKKTLGSLCDFLNGYAFKSKDTVDASNVQLLRMGNLYNNKLDLERRSVFYPESFANDYNKYIINPGDIVMTLTGTVGKRDYGYAIEISEAKLKLLLNQRILKLHNFKSNIINKKYLLFYLSSKSFLNVLFKTANGTRQANLSSDTIKKLKIPVPSMDNQIEILKKLKLLDENKKILLENLKTKSRLLKSLKFSLIKNLIKDKAA